MVAARRQPNAMYGPPKCPKCEDVIRQCDSIKMVAGNQFSGPSFNAVAMSCPKCGTVLGVSVDPIALVDDIVSQVTANMRKTK